MSSLLSICLLFVSTVAFNYSPVVPVWPTIYKTCVVMHTDGEVVSVGWYADSTKKRMRLDTYGTPNDEHPVIVSTPVDGFQYACAHLGEPLYEFIYDYGRGIEFDTFPSPNAPYKHCNTKNITNPFPGSPILQGIHFIEEGRDNFTVYHHWRAEYFLFTLDYYFHKLNGLPYKFFVDQEEQRFISFDVTSLDDDTFMPPKGVTCTPYS